MTTKGICIHESPYQSKENAKKKRVKKMAIMLIITCITDSESPEESPLNIGTE